METLNISGKEPTKASQPQKDVWYKDLVIILFLTMILGCLLYSEPGIM